MQEKTVYIKPKVVGRFLRPYGRESYMHWAALFSTAMGANLMSIFIFSTTETVYTRWADWHFGITASAHNLWRYLQCL
jgi:hypothetical protein